ncbi:GyrI-like domain-containing protein [Brevibacterium sp. BRM-1]|uniref:GyrI-like domain-containing protein n=1 Tax=Brevibacterium sp. BRM-1 TaxID=2999062 RepID=UPI00227FBFA3|nr:GyrI-like domain-containing protein [Brevibacterium sp. BRM-1]WAL40090.1 GyrI-like domain-containing protein [Brevibacterium sp. BRM-1]
MSRAAAAGAGGGPAVEIAKRAAVPTAAAAFADVAFDRLPELYDRVFSQLFAALVGRGIEPAGAPYGLYTRVGETVDVQIGVPLGAALVEPFALDEEVEIRGFELPAGTVASTVHVGGYDGLPAAWQALVAELRAAGREAVQPCWEVYLDQPQPGGDPRGLRTELVTLVR